jgi:hypothetical protein
MEQKKPTRITYLFGAGASVGNGYLLNTTDMNTIRIKENPVGIPVVENLNIDIGIFLRNIFESNVATNKEFAELKKLFYSLYNEFKDIFSYDTYAKSLYEKHGIDHIKYNELKLLLKCYLIYRQNATAGDKRYDLLFATLITNKKIPSNINFLSWNYDTQVEISLSKFTSIEKNMRFFQFVDIDPDTDKTPKLIKLNGSISEIEDDFKYSIPSKASQIRLENEILGLFKEFKNGGIPIISFSWEQNDLVKKRRERAKIVLSNTDILIIIGYSFPTLNRKVDKELLEALPTATKFYIQCGSEKDYEEIVSKIGALCPKHKRQKIGPEYNSWYNIEYIPQNKEFYVPFEFENE